MTVTIAELVDAHGFDILEHLDREVTVPVLDGVQFQGDLGIIPAAAARNAALARAVPPEGVPVIAAVGGGHEHRLFASVPGTAWWTPTEGGQDIGTLTCTEPAYLAHVEHAYAGVAPGSYILRRQREQADKERLVAD
jgi:hypothetical protein